VVVGSALVDAIGAAAEARANDIPARVAAQIAALAQAVRSARQAHAAKEMAQ
jgi:tryptophan synthase alpha chain